MNCLEAADSAQLPLKIRGYRGADAQHTLEVYVRAIRETASAHYRPDQIDAWCPPHLDVAAWARARSRAWTIVAELEDAVVGFCDLTDEAEVGMLFVAPRVGGRGIAQEMIAAALSEARRRGYTRVTTRASRGARATFARCGFVVDRENRTNKVRGALVPNFEMHAELNGVRVVPETNSEPGKTRQNNHFD